jgi:Family of unknown function (DUF6510)
MSADTTLDGNGMAGLLSELLATEPTTTVRHCASCGHEHPLAAHRAYQAAGVVLRCPTCEDVGVRIVERETELLVELRGVLRVPRAT